MAMAQPFSTCEANVSTSQTSGGAADCDQMYFVRCVKNLSLEDHFRANPCLRLDGLSNLSKRKLSRRDATGFKKLPHSDDFLLWQIAMSVRECSGTSIEHHTDSIAGLIVHLCPQVLQEMYDLFEINIRAERVSE
jgi:hypothetical protein